MILIVILPKSKSLLQIINLIKFYLIKVKTSLKRETRPEGLEPSTSNFGD